MAFFGWARVVVFQITNVTVLHSDEVPGGRVPGIQSCTEPAAGGHRTVNCDYGRHFYIVAHVGDTVLVTNK